jgi:hypothetical protein
LYIHVIVRTRDTAPTSQTTRDRRTVYARPRTNPRYTTRPSCSCRCIAREYVQAASTPPTTAVGLPCRTSRRDAETVGSRLARGLEHERAVRSPVATLTPTGRARGGSPPASSVTHLPMASVGPGGWDGPVALACRGRCTALLDQWIRRWWFVRAQSRHALLAFGVNVLG